MLTLNGKKMSKSIGNNVYPNEIFSGDNDLLSKAYAPAVVRFFMMQAHYSSILDLSETTVHCILRSCLKKLEANNLAHAATNAVLLGEFVVSA